MWRVLGTNVERMIVQTDWENEEAVIYLQHRLSRIGVDDALESAGCKPGDEVRIMGHAFAYEGAEGYGEDDEADAADDLPLSLEGDGDGAAGDSAAGGRA